MTRALVAEGFARLWKTPGFAGGYLLGTPYFCAALSENGCLSEAYDLLLKKDFPGWLYQVAQGATTVWEHWDGRRPDGTMWSAGMNSFNHYAYGAVGAWLYSAELGFDQQPGTAGFAAARLAPPARAAG